MPLETTTNNNNKMRQFCGAVMWQKSLRWFLVCLDAGNVFMQCHSLFNLL